MKVSADHKIEKYGCRDRDVRIGEARDYINGEVKIVGYYVSIAGYGCSKNYRTAKDAVYGMLQEHACTNIYITE